MARIRSIKPEFFVSEQVADVSPTCRLLFVGMWLFCDDAGIHPASPRQLKMEIFPGDPISVDEVASMVADLVRVGLLMEYEAELKKYWRVTGWHHQKIERPRFVHPQPNSTTSRRQVDDRSTTPRSPRVRAGSDRTGPETIGRDKSSARSGDRFVPPSVEDVKTYSEAAGLALDAGKFVDFYTAKGWKVGRNPMKDWRAAARNASRDGWAKAGASGGEMSADEYRRDLERRTKRTRDYLAVPPESNDGQ